MVASPVLTRILGSIALIPLPAARFLRTPAAHHDETRDLTEKGPITGRLEGRDLGSVIADVKAVLATERLPVGYTWQLGGQYESQQNSFRSLLVVAGLSFISAAPRSTCRPSWASSFSPGSS
jgi:Cu/Ag efflux pump CusA